MVIWLLGLSGAGKTTLGVLLEKYLVTNNVACQIIDGDEVRNFFDNDLGYTIEERKQNVKRIMYGAYVLEKTGVCSIICNISPWDDLRGFARRKFKDYNEVYLKKSLDACMEKDVKGVYRKNKSKGSIIGLDIKFEEPVRPDLVLDTEHESIQQSFAKLTDYLAKKYNLANCDFKELS